MPRSMSIILEPYRPTQSPTNTFFQRQPQSVRYKPLFSANQTRPLHARPQSPVPDIPAGLSTPVTANLSAIEGLNNQSEANVSPSLTERILASTCTPVSSSSASLPTKAPTIFDFMAQGRYRDPNYVLTSNQEYFMKQSVLQYREATLISGLKDSLSTSSAKLHFSRSKTAVLVLDLDETLIHAEPLVPGVQYDAVLSFEAGHGLPAENMGVNKRPFVELFLAKMHQLFDLVVFTASNQDYADKVVELLDPHNQYFKLRLYRQDCIRANNKLVKDLSCFDTDQVYLLDNYIYSFAWDLGKGIPIYPFFSNPYDEELLTLIEVLSQVGSGTLSEVVRRGLDPEGFLAHLHELVESEDKDRRDSN